MQVVIAIATCRRPRGLTRLLNALARLRIPEQVQVEVLVVDNDRAGSAADAVRAARDALPFPLTYLCEPCPGVSAVRNTALAAAAGRDALAFIDDDEWPEPGWLAALIKTQQQSGAIAVCGPVHPWFERQAPAWLRAAFETVYLRPLRGGTVRELATNNLLLALAPLRAHDLAFDPSLGLIGGEDTLFGEDLRARGFHFAWSENAIVHEHVPSARAGLPWLIRRWYRTGNVETLIRLRRWQGPLARPLIVVAGLLRIVLGTAALLSLVPLFAIGRPLAVLLRLRTICRGLGMIAAACGRFHREYGAHGRDERPETGRPLDPAAANA